MSFKEFLEDYDAKEEEQLRRYWSQFSEGRAPADTRYPPAARFPRSRLPLAQPQLCNVWGVIPFHGSVLLPLPCVNNREMFDFLLEDTGISAATLPQAMNFARETGRLAFGLAGHATLYRELDFLEPLFREFSPPRGTALPLEDIIDRVAFQAHCDAFFDLASHGFTGYLADYMASSGGGGETHLHANLNNYSGEYAFLRLCGYEELANAIERTIVENPGQAHQLLSVFESLIVEPSLNVVGGPIVLGEPVLAVARTVPSVRVFPASAAGGDVDRYDVGKLVLSKIVAYPETEEGCRRIIQEYSAAGLDEARNAFLKAVEEENLESLTASASAISETCERAWAQANYVGTIEKLGGLAPAITVGVIGTLATGSVEAGVGLSVGARLAEEGLGKHTGRALAKGITRLVGKSHLISLYDFKRTLPPGRRA